MKPMKRAITLAIVATVGFQISPMKAIGQGSAAIPRGGIPRGGASLPRGFGIRGGIPATAEVAMSAEIIGRAGVLRAGASALRAFRGATSEETFAVRILSRGGMKVGDLEIRGNSAAIRNSSGEIVGRLSREGGKIQHINSAGERVGYSEIVGNEVIHYSLDATGRSFEAGRQQGARVVDSNANASILSLPLTSVNDVILSLGSKEVASAAFQVKDFGDAPTSQVPTTLTIGGSDVNCVKMKDLPDNYIDTMSFSPDGEAIYLCFNTGEVILCSSRTGNILRRSTLENPNSTKLDEARFAASGRFLIARFEESFSKLAWGVWSLPDLQYRAELAPVGAQAFTFANDGALVAYAYEEEDDHQSLIDIVEVATTRVIRSINVRSESDNQRVQAMAIDAKHNLLAVSSGAGLQFFSIADGRLVLEHKEVKS